MNTPDDLQKLWQQDNPKKENHNMWMHLIEEKRTGFHELVRAANQAEYLVALSLGPILALLAWKAKYPLVQAGFGLLAATLAMLAVVLAISTRAAQRRRPEQNDHSVRDHLQALIDSYDQRIRAMWSGRFWVSLPFSAGLVAVIMGKPGFVTRLDAWIVVCVLLAGFWGGQRLSCQRARALLSKKREDAARLLRELPGGGLNS
jgi:hypothetical protein